MSLFCQHGVGRQLLLLVAHDRAPAHCSDCPDVAPVVLSPCEHWFRWHHTANAPWCRRQSLLILLVFSPQLAVEYSGLLAFCYGLYSSSTIPKLIVANVYEPKVRHHIFSTLILTLTITLTIFASHLNLPD